MRSPKGRLELTWMGKDMALIPAEDGKYDYEWVDPADPRACEVKSIEVVKTVGETAAAPGASDNLLIVGDSGDALRSLGTIPEWAAKYRGKVKLLYIDPPFNTEQIFEHYADQLEHSIWLTMMRDRVRDIKPLLADDASIWVHLDDSEVHRMRAAARPTRSRRHGRSGRHRAIRSSAPRSPPAQPPNSSRPPASRPRR